MCKLSVCNDENSVDIFFSYNLSLNVLIVDIRAQQKEFSVKIRIQSSYTFSMLFYSNAAAPMPSNEEIVITISKCIKIILRISPDMSRYSLSLTNLC